MGTRCLTVIMDGGVSEDSKTEIAVMYRQMDGYPEGHGRELAEFLRGIVLVNGISLNAPDSIANGMECLAAQIVAHFKKCAGSFYLKSAGTRDVGEEYIYTVRAKDGQIVLDTAEAFL